MGKRNRPHLHKKNTKKNNISIELFWDAGVVEGVLFPFRFFLLIGSTRCVWRFSKRICTRKGFTWVHLNVKRKLVNPWLHHKEYHLQPPKQSPASALLMKYWRQFVWVLFARLKEFSTFFTTSLQQLTLPSIFLF